jgi:hypothetical protein
MLALYMVEYAARRAAFIAMMHTHEGVMQKEGSMKPVYDAQSLNLSHLNPQPVSYHPKNIHTEAIQVTPDNIGKLSLEFEEELFYGADGRPYFVFSAKRFDPDEPDGQQPPNELYLRLTDWIVPLWDEIHVFRDVVFQKTFTFNEPVLSSGLHSIGRSNGSFKPNDRVRVRKTGDWGIVTVVDGEHEGKSSGQIEVFMNSDGCHHDFEADELERMGVEVSSGVVIPPAEEHRK